MIISPPFLPPRTARQSDAAWIELGMTQPPSRAPQSNAREGSFPLSAAFMWHNGIHIAAPATAGVYAEVRAVAEGTVIFSKIGTTKDADAAHPQNYNPFGTGPAWTDNGIVIIEHEAEVGASNDAAAIPTVFVFYSLYMHLASLQDCPITKARWKKGDKVQRKDVLGEPGSIYGHAGQIHFEICCDKPALEKILNRTARWEENDPVEEPKTDGRTDALFGAIYVYLPGSTHTASIAPVRHVLPIAGAGRGIGWSEILGTAQWVALRYDKGNLKVSSYTTSGKKIGVDIDVPDAEYALYREATERHESLHEADRLKSSPSGWFGLLRFGRNLGYGNGTDLLPDDAQHWRRIPTSVGTIWADLNSVGSHKFSDADFPLVAGWNCFDDDRNTNSQLCESPQLRRLLRHQEDIPYLAKSERRGEIDERRSIARRLGDVAVQPILRKAVCCFPTEWDRNTVEQRHSWLRDPSEGLHLEDAANWAVLATHLNYLSFPDLPASYKNATWRFHPTEFIVTFKSCGWLSKNELAKIYPATDAAIRSNYWKAINDVMRKFLITDGNRQSHFFGQGAVESDCLRDMQEKSMRGIIEPTRLLGRTINPRSAAMETDHWYGDRVDEDDAWFRLEKFNSRGVRITRSYSWVNGNAGDIDAQKFRGRGFKQLTGLDNYAGYWLFRGWLHQNSFDRNWWNDPQYKLKNASGMIKRMPCINNPHTISNNPFNCLDSGGWYLIFKRPRVMLAIDNDKAELAVTANDKILEKSVSLAVTVAINGGRIGDERRLEFTRQVKMILL